MLSSMRRHRTDLIDLSPRLEVVALVMAAQQQERLAHMVSGILDLMDEQRQDRGGTVRGISKAGFDH